MKRASLVIGAIALGAAAAPAQAGDGVRSHVTIAYSQPATTAIFSGDVTSKKAPCFKARKVTVKIRPSGKTLGTDTTNADGHYVVKKEVPFQGEFAYAKVKTEEIKSLRCRGAKSDDVSVSG
jgi:hypothetical protein